MPDPPPEAVHAAAIQHVEYRGFTDPEPEDYAIAEDMLRAALPHLHAAKYGEHDCTRASTERRGTPAIRRPPAKRTMPFGFGQEVNYGPEDPAVTAAWEADKEPDGGEYA